MKYHYQVFGLVFQSDLVLPNLPSAKKKIKVNVRIERGQVDPVRFSFAKGQALHVRYSTQKFWFRVPGIALFFVINGNKIVYQPEEGSDEQSIALYVLGNCMGALLHQRGFIVLRAMAVRFNNEAVIFAGSSGQGKTLLAASLHKKSYQVLTDELCVIDAAGLVYPGYPWLKLWQDCFKVMEITAGELQRIRPNIEKYFYPLGQLHANKPLPFYRMYLMQRWNKDKPEITQINGMSKFNLMRLEIYDLQNVIGMDLLNNSIKKLMKLAGKTTLRRLVRPPKITVERWIKLIEEDVRK